MIRVFPGSVQETRLSSCCSRIVGEPAHPSTPNLLKWWPGTELNRRRQPFQGCALPPELPGHVLSAQLCPQNDWRPNCDRAPCALSLGGRREAKQPMRWDRAELSNYNNPFPFPQNDCEPSSHGAFSLDILSRVFSRRFFMEREGRSACRS